MKLIPIKTFKSGLHLERAILSDTDASGFILRDLSVLGARKYVSCVCWWQYTQVVVLLVLLFDSSTVGVDQFVKT